MTVDSRPETEEYEVTLISKINVETIGGVYMLLPFKKEYGSDINYYHK